MSVLLVTCASMMSGEPGAERLDEAFAARGIEARWVAWDDETVDWAAADVVAVRSAWDYTERHADFLAWAREVEQHSLLLNGAATFAWNVDKSYLTRLTGLPVVPTRLVDDANDAASAYRDFGPTVLKPRVGAGGDGLVMVRSVADLPQSPRQMIAQPLVDSVFTDGERSIYVLEGAPVAAFAKVPGAGEDVRVNEEHGGSVRPADLDAGLADLAASAAAQADAISGRALDYCRVDVLRHEGTWCVSEIEVTEPGLYLDVSDAMAGPFADLVRRRVADLRG